MALTRKMMQGMGLTEEQVNAIIEGHEESITGLKSKIDEYEALKEESDKKLAKVQKELDNTKAEAEKNDGKNPWKVKYEAMKEEFDNFKAEKKAEATKSAKEKAYRELLKDTGVSEKRINAVMKVTDLDKVELDEEGKIKDVDEHKKSIKEEWSDFIPTEDTKGADTPNPPGNTGGKMSKEEILAIKDTDVRQAKMLENKELFIK